MTLTRNESGKLESYAWPGGYEIHYIAADGGTFCHECANGGNGSEASEMSDDASWRLVGAGTHWEEEAGSPLHCDHCGRRIEPEYGEIEATS